MTNNPQYSNLPLAELQKLGIDENMLASMPEEVRGPLMSGGITPVVQTRIEIGNGKAILMPARLHVVPNHDGRSGLMLYPVQREFRNDLNLSKNEIDTIMRGDILPKVLNEDGKFRMMLIQYDPQTKSAIKADVAKLNLDAKLKDIEKVHDITLGQEQRQRIREGKPIELSMGNNKPVTVGLDLRQPDGVRFLQNDLKAWERQKMIDYDIAHPEFRGYVMTDKNEWEYAQTVKVQSHNDQKAKEELSRKSGFHM